MSSGTSVMKTLEMAKTYLSPSVTPVIDFCSLNTMNFSTKIFYSTSTYYPSLLHMNIYQKFDKFKFINKLFFEINSYDSSILKRFMEKLPYLEEVYFVDDASNKCNELSFIALNNRMGIRNNPTLPDFNFLYERGLNFLEFDYSHNINLSYFSREKDYFPVFIPRCFNVKNLHIKLGFSPEKNYQDFMVCFNKKLLQDMGDVLETLKINNRRDHVENFFPTIVFGKKLKSIKIIDHQWTTKSSDIMGETDKIETLMIFYQKISNSLNLVFPNLTLLGIVFRDVKNRMKDYKNWFPNLSMIEILFKPTHFEDDDNTEFFDKETIDEIYESFPFIILILNRVSTNVFPEGVVFRNDVIFKNTERYPIDISHVEFEGGIIFDSEEDDFSSKTENYLLDIKHNKKQDIILNNYVMAAERDENLFKKIYLLNPYNKNRMDYVSLNGPTKIYPAIIEKTINNMNLFKPYFFHQKFVPKFINSLEIYLKLPNKKNTFLINDENFPCLNYFRGENINVKLSKTLLTLNLTKSHIDIGDICSVVILCLVKCRVYNMDNLTILTHILLISNNILKDVTLNYANGIKKIHFEKNYGKKIILPNKNKVTPEEVFFNSNKCIFLGELSLSLDYSSDYSDYYPQFMHKINIEGENYKDFKIFIVSKKIIMTESFLDLRGDNIFGNFEVFYKPFVNKCINYKHSHIVFMTEIGNSLIFIKSSNIKGMLSFIKIVNEKHIYINFEEKSVSFDHSFNFSLFGKQINKSYLEERVNETVFTSTITRGHLDLKRSRRETPKYAFPFENNLMVLPSCIFNGSFYPAKVTTLKK